MTDWSEDITLTFLEAYQKEPCIWNPKHVNHKNRQKVSDAWTRISIIVNKNVKELKNKKEILMATFRRHLKKKQDSIRSGAGADKVYKPIWFAYELMESFLLAVYTSTRNIKTEEGASSSHEADETAAIEQEIEDNDLSQPSTAAHMPKPVNTHRRSAIDLPERQMSNVFGQLTNILNKRKKESTREDDDCDLYSKLLAKKLRELPPDDRKLFMYDIDTLFINRIKEKIRHHTLSPHSSVPYQSYSLPSPNASSISSQRPSTSQTSYSVPLPDGSPISNRPSTSQTSCTEPLPNNSPIPNSPSTSQAQEQEQEPSSKN